MIKKFLTYSLVVTTMVWSVGLLATPLAVGAASSGDLIKLQCSTGAGTNDPCKAVYYLGADNKRYVFPNQPTYLTWYSNFNGVKIVSQTEMSSYAIGGNVTYRPGVKLVKITTDPKVYAVAANGTLRWVTTGDIATALFGSTWNKMVEDVSDAFFVNYTIGADITAASQYDKTAEMNNASTINDDKNIGGPVSSGSSLTVALASDTPATGIVVANSINNKFTKVNLTASADGNIVIDQLKVRRGGTIASDAAFSSLAIIDAATGKRIGDTKTLNSEHVATFNEDITIAAGTTKSIYLAGNMASSLASQAGEIPSLDLAAVVLAGGTVVGSLPVIGNYQNINGTISIGQLTLSNGSNNPSASTQKVGQTDYIVSGFKLSNGSVEDFKVSSVTFHQGGTADDTDVANLDLLVDDTVVKTVATVSKDYVTFDFSASPIMIEKGKQKQFDLRVDIASGSNRTLRFDIEDESDVVAAGQLYGAESKVAAGSGATADADPFWTAPVTTVAQGSLSVGAATLSAANVPNDSDQVILGKFEFEARGEAIEVTRLPINFTITTTTGSAVSAADLTNISLVDENGAVVAGPQDSALQSDVEASSILYVGVTSTDSFMVPVGKHIYTVKGDLSSDFTSNTTLVARISNAGISAKGDSTGLAISAITGEPTSATMTVQAASLSVSVSPSEPVATSVVAGAKDHVFSAVILGTQSSGEDIKVTSVKVAIHTTGSVSPSKLSDFKLWDGATVLSTSNNPSDGPAAVTTNGNSATATFTLTTPLVITKGTTKTLKVSADIDTNASGSSSFKVGMSDTTGSNHVTARGNSGNDATITISVSDGQAQSVQSTGSLTITRDSTSPKDGLLPANSSGVTFAVFNASAQYEPVNVEKIYLTGVAANGGGWDQITKVYIYDGATKLAEVTPTSSDAADRTVLVDVTNSPIVIPKDSSRKLTIKVDTATSNYESGSTGASGQGLWIKIAAAGDVTAKGANSGTTVSSPSISNASSTAQYLFRSVPIVGTDASAGGTLNAGTVTRDLYKFTVTASSAGDIALHHVSFLVATNTATVTDLRISDGSQNVGYLPNNAWTIASNVAGSGTQTGYFYFVNNQTAPTTASSNNVVPYVVPAGTTKTFTLIGSVECASAGLAACSGTNGSGSISVSFLGDTRLPGTLPTTASGLSASSFVWSDLWRTNIQGVASTTASGTEQWSNGNLVEVTNGGKLQATSTAVSFSR